LGAACAAHARRNFEELTRDGTSVVGLEAVRRFARIYGVEAQLKDLSDDERRAQRQRFAKPLWEELRQWLQLERRLVVDGGPTAKAIRLHAGALVRLDAAPGRRRGCHRQQPPRASDQTLGDGPQ
jgi:hypothetical protein